MDKNVITPRNRGTDVPQAHGAADSDTVSTQRRKLIKVSAVAVPAIMTLRSGAAAAVGSMNGCIHRDAARAAIELDDDDRVLGDDPLEPAHDEWARVTGKAGKKVTAKVEGTVGVYYGILLMDLSFAYYDSNGIPVTGDGEINQIENGDAINFYCVLKSNVWECLTEAGTTLLVPAGVDIDGGKDVGLLIYVATTTEDGIIGTTYYPKVARVQDVNASPITESCLCSMDPDFSQLV